MIFCRSVLLLATCSLHAQLALADAAAFCDSIGPGEPGYYACSSSVERSLQRAQPLLAYWNAATQQLYVGDRVFDKDDHVAAKETWGRYNTKKPEGPGWIGLTESSYTSYMAEVNGHKTPTQTGSEAIYRNCVIEKSVNQPESVVREIRAACRAISSNPSIDEKWKWGE